MEWNMNRIHIRLIIIIQSLKVLSYHEYFTGFVGVKTYQMSVIGAHCTELI
jgi:hypothetical protein